MDFPDDFIIRTKQWLGNEYCQLEKALQEEEVPVSIRINPFKPSMPVAGYEKVKWCETGYYLPSRPSFTYDPLFHAGSYYVQEASSMFLEQVIKQYISEPIVCLDLCAAPGGKSTHLLSVLPETSLIVSNEVIHSRSLILKENLTKWGSPFSVLSNDDPKEIGYLTHLFDIIIADLPCSGEGLFRKEPNSRKEWSLAIVKLCAARQRRIVQDIWNSLKPGGLLVYSTCTFNREENEENISYLIDVFNAEVLPVSIDKDWGICPAIDESFPVYRFYPHKIKGEGFCLTLLRKPDDKRLTIRTQKSKCNIQKSKHPSSSYVPPFIKSLVANADTFQFEIKQNTIRAIPALHQDTYHLLFNNLRIVSAGVLIGEVKRNDFIPASAFALSTCFRMDAFPSIELSLEDSISYLQKDSLMLSTDIPTGFVVVKYCNTPLGFVKNIGNRANNHYPNEWRIRKRLS